MMQLTAEDGHKFEVFEAGNINAPRCLVVLQEIFGVNAHMRRVAERLAGFGYRVLCPALFDRVARNVALDYAPADMQRGAALRGQIAAPAVLADIEAAAIALGERPIGVIGYCWGGSLAWRAATETRRFKAAIGWYGGEIARNLRATPACPVQLHFGGADSGIPVSDVRAIEAAHPQIPVFLYPGAQHGFGCEARSSYSAQDAELAELRSLAFFAEHLR